MKLAQLGVGKIIHGYIAPYHEWVVFTRSNDFLSEHIICVHFTAEAALDFLELLNHASKGLRNWLVWFLLKGSTQVDIIPFAKLIPLVLIPFEIVFEDGK